jgi:hypothetical protein
MSTKDRNDSIGSLMPRAPRAAGTSRSIRRSSRLLQRGALGVAFAVATAMLSSATLAGPNEQAMRLYNRIAGVPPSASELSQMATDIQSGNAMAAAAIATNSPNFYNTVLKNWAMPWTNRDMTAFAPLNDYVATVIGMVRDNVPFNTALSADILYMSNAPGLPAPSNADNNHYATAEANNVDLQATLVQTTQSGTYGIPSDATAGLITTRGSASSFFINGTNRAMFRFTLIAHLCNDMPQVEDITRPPDRIRQDVSRSPGGDSRVFLNTCIGCHSGMDPMAQAFAYYNFVGTVVGDGLNTGALQYTPGQVQPKYHINATNFPQGYFTTDDSWSNYWRVGPNQILGWSSSLPGSGQGAKSLGQELENSTAFAACKVQQVFQAVCYRAPENSADLTEVAQMQSDFQSGGYSLKQMFQEAGVYCMGN